MVMPLVVSHYTVDTPYEEEVKNLVKSCKEWKLELDLTPIKSLGTWRANSNFCSKVIQSALSRFPGRDILRVDADAVFEARPVIFENPKFVADIAAHVHDFSWHRNELLGGTIFFRNNPVVQTFVAEWAELCMGSRKRKRNPDLLQELLNSGKYNLKFGCLPAQYCKIFDLMRNVPDGVIIHNQASRRFRRVVNA